MAVLVFETIDSRAQTISVDAPKCDLVFTVVGTDDDGEMRSNVLAAIPANYLGLIFQNFDAKPRGPQIWDVTVHYSRTQPGTPGTMTIEGDTGSEQVKITHSLSSDYFPASLKEEDDAEESDGDGSDAVDNEDGSDEEEEGGETDPGGATQPAIDFKGAILVRERGGKLEPEGIEETLPSQAFVINRFFGTDTAGNEYALTAGYLQTLMKKAHHVNTDTIDIVVQGMALHFAPGELWYKGMTFKIGSDGKAEVNMKLAKSPNRTGVVMGGVTFDAKGWAFVWPFSEEYEDTEEGPDGEEPTNLVIPRVRQINVEQTKRETTLRELFV